MLSIAQPQEAPQPDINPIDYHKIDQATHRSMISAYFPSGGPAEQCMNAAMLQSFLDAAGPTGELDCRPGPATNRNDIVFSTHADNHVPGHIDYHLALFERLMQAPYSATVFCFSKAKKNGAVDVVFRAMRGGDTVYYADLSHI